MSSSPRRLRAETPHGVPRWRSTAAAVLLLAACAHRPLTDHAHPLAPPCAVTEGGTIVTCGGQRFAALECWSKWFVGCMTLVVRYADGDSARIYHATGDPKFDFAWRVAMLDGGARLVFLEREGPFLSTQWHEYDLRSGLLRDLRPEEGEAATRDPAAVPLVEAARTHASPPD